MEEVKQAVKVYRLINGQDFIGYDAGEKTLRTPMAILHTQQGTTVSVVLVPFFPLAADPSADFPLNSQVVLAEYEPCEKLNKEFEENVMRIKSEKSGIILPPGGKIHPVRQ